MQHRAIAADLLTAVAAVATAWAVSQLLLSALGVTRVGVIYLLAVMIAGIYRGRTAGLAAAPLAAVAYYSSITTDTFITLSPESAVAVFLVAALVAGGLTGAVRQHGRSIETQSRRVELLFNASRSMTVTADEKAIWFRLCDCLEDLSNQAVLIDPSGEELWSLGAEVSDETVEAAHHAFSDSKKIRAGHIHGFRAFPLKNGSNHLGVLLWRPSGVVEEQGREEIVSILVDIAAASVGRCRLSEEAARLKTRAQGEQFREVLLSSVSHDFRSPLAAILGSVTSLLEYGDRFDSTIRRDLLLNTKEEAERLNHFVENLLSWSRIKAGSLQLNIAPVNLIELSERVVRRLLGSELASRCSIEANGAVVARADPVLLEQAMFNLVDNALRYSGPDRNVMIRIGGDPDYCRIDVIDEGPGMAQEDLSGLFEGLSPTQIHGSGLGLAIAKGLLEAIHGGIEVGQRADGARGLRVTVSVPAQP